MIIRLRKIKNLNNKNTKNKIDDGSGYELFDFWICLLVSQFGRFWSLTLGFRVFQLMVWGQDRG